MTKGCQANSKQQDQSIRASHSWERENDSNEANCAMLSYVSCVPRYFLHIRPEIPSTRRLDSLESIRVRVTR